MASRHIPDDAHVGLVEAALMIARARHPERWADAILHPKERELWMGLGITFNADIWADHIRVLVPPDIRAADEHATIHRMADFGDAQDDLRRALYAGQLVAKYIDDHGHAQSIERDMWWTEAGAEVVRKGVAWVDERDQPDEVCRYLFIARQEVERLFLGGPVGHEEKGATQSSGAAGRPTSMHLIILEASRRFAAGEQVGSMKAFADSLSKWLSVSHPSAVPTKPKTITNNPEFRRVYRAAQNSAQK